MKTRKNKKGGDIKIFGYTLKKTGPSVSKLKKMLLEVNGEKYINIDPIIREWADFDPKIKKWILKDKYKSMFVQAYTETIVVVVPPFTAIDTLSTEVTLYKTQQPKEIQVVLGSIKDRLLKIKSLPLSLKEFIQKWINYTSKYVSFYELSEISKLLETKQVTNDTNPIANLPVPPLVKGGDGDKESSHQPDSYFTFKFICEILECICHLLLLILMAQ